LLADLGEVGVGVPVIGPVGGLGAGGVVGEHDSLADEGAPAGRAGDDALVGEQLAEPVAAAMARRLDGCGRDELVFCGPGGSNGVPRGARSRLSVGNYRRVYRLAVARAELAELDPHGPHDLRHTFATWLEDGAVPARVIDELMGHQAGRRGEREGSMIGTRYRHMTEAMQARVVAVIAERLTVALAAMPQVCPKPESEGEAAC
jgi:hypothetical protein